MTFEKVAWTKELFKVPSGWKGLEEYMPSIISKLNIKTNLALEFGVDSGYSLKILSQIFDKAVGVDAFLGDSHIGHEQGDVFYKEILNKFSNTNVELVKSKYQDFIKNNNSKYDLIHVDIVHFYKETYECAEWSLQHSNVVLIHDTCTFPDMAKVCVDLSKKYSAKYYNITECNGLGVLYRR